MHRMLLLREKAFFAKILQKYNLIYDQNSDLKLEPKLALKTPSIFGDKIRCIFSYAWLSHVFLRMKFSFSNKSLTVHLPKKQSTKNVP